MFESTKATHLVRPWVRYLARAVDLYVFSFVFGLVFYLVFGAIAPQSAEAANEIVLSLITIFLWIFVEALLLSSFQTTPGKWLFKTKLKLASGAKIDFSQALTRSLKVWWRGLGAGFPIVTLFTLMIAYKKLIREGMTSWDSDAGFTVVHEEIGAARVFAVIVAFLITCLISVNLF